MRIIFSLLLFLLSIIVYNPALAQTVKPVPYYSMLNWDTSPYQSFRFTPKNGGSSNWINFRILYPEGYDPNSSGNQKYPLTIVLHGAGESARMEWNNGTKTNSPYPENDPRKDNNDHHLRFGGKEHLQAVKDGRFPGIVLFPQNFYGTWVDGKGEPDSKMRQDLQTTLDLITYLIENNQIDPKRIYIQGLSNGGVGSWYAAYKRPDLFAAVLPMSAHGFPSMASRLANIPVWVFQGALDTNPSPRTTEKTVEAIENAGGSIRYTLYEEAEHNTWDRAYRESDFFKWMLAQTKENEIVPNKNPIAEAGQELTILLPQDYVDFTGTASDEDGIILSANWSKISGPDAIIHQPDSLSTRISGLKEGNYVFRLSVTDDRGATVWDEITVKVENTPLAVKSTNELNFKVTPYPNPFSGDLNLKISSKKPQEILLSVFNSQGGLVFQQRISVKVMEEQTYELAVPPSLAQGLYFVQLQNREGSLRKGFPLLKK